MTWSGSTNKQESGKMKLRRRRQNSSSSSRGSPSPKLLDERYSPVQTIEKPLYAMRISPSLCSVDGALSRSPSPQGSAYAGPRFSDPPSPENLPKPPSHWTGFGASVPSLPSNCSDMSSQLKLLLKVAVQQA